MLALEVAAQTAAGGETKLTDMAAVRLFSRVDHLVMKKSRGVPEAFRAHSAAVGALPGVTPDVVHQIKRMLEALDTVRALERFQFSVSGKMAPQVRTVAEALVTFGAMEGGSGACSIDCQERGVILSI